MNDPLYDGDLPAGSNSSASQPADRERTTAAETSPLSSEVTCPTLTAKQKTWAAECFSIKCHEINTDSPQNNSHYIYPHACAHNVFHHYYYYYSLNPKGEFISWKSWISWIFLNVSAPLAACHPPWFVVVTPCRTCLLLAARPCPLPLVTPSP